MESSLSKAIDAVQQADIAFSKYITANDTGSTGAHMAGYHIHKNAWPLFFDTPGVRGENKDVFVTIRWQDDFETNSRFTYYGKKRESTKEGKGRNEYRLTRLGRGFPFRGDDNIGDLLVIVKKSATYYEAFVLQSDEDIEEFLSALNVSPTGTNAIIPKANQQTAEDKLLACFMLFLKALEVDFPPTIDIAERARLCYNQAYRVTPKIIQKEPDREILHWLNAEFELFKTIENDRYSQRIMVPFRSVEEFVDTANTILNRRKNRAGTSLEHHLAEIFRIFGIRFSSQEITEDRKKPDFIFPGVEEYQNARFNEEKLFVLAAKRTCKDRWRQILNEADRVKTKHLFTLQQGISVTQLDEMYKYNVCLVVPKPNIKEFPKTFHDRIMNLEDFVGRVRSSQE